MKALYRLILLVFVALVPAGCTFPDAAVWRTIAYTKLAQSSSEAGDAIASREAAALALETAWNLEDAEFAEWAMASAVAARVHADDPAGAEKLVVRWADDGASEAALGAYFLILALIDKGEPILARRALDRIEGTLAPGGEGDEEAKALMALALIEIGDVTAAFERAAELDSAAMRGGLIRDNALRQARDGDVEAALESLAEARSLTNSGKSEVSDPVYRIARAIARRGTVLYAPILRDFRVPRGGFDGDWDSPAEAYVVLHIAVAKARRGGIQAAQDIVERLSSTDRRAVHSAWVATALADVGDLPAARDFADRALGFLPDAESHRPRDVPWVAYAMVRVGDAELGLSIADAHFEPGSEAGAAAWSAVALAQAESGDPVGMAESIDLARADMEIACAGKTEESAAEALMDVAADWAWILALGGDVAGAVDMATDTPDPDKRAFALIPAASELAARHDWGRAAELVTAMVSERDRRVVTKRLNELRVSLAGDPAGAEVPGLASWHRRGKLNLELLRTLAGRDLPDLTPNGVPTAGTLLETATSIQDGSFRARLYAWAAELQAQAGNPDAARARLKTALAAARSADSPYGRAVALIEIAYAQAILGVDAAALVTLDEAARAAAAMNPND